MLSWVLVTANPAPNTQDDPLHRLLPHTLPMCRFACRHQMSVVSSNATVLLTPPHLLFTGCAVLCCVCSPLAAAAYLGSQQALSTCSAAEDTEYEEADVTRVTQQPGQAHPPFPRPLQELLLPAAAAAGEGCGVPEGVEMREVAACQLPGDTHSLAEVGL
jgi:hypothetical protein